MLTTYSCAGRIIFDGKGTISTSRWRGKNFSIPTSDDSNQKVEVKEFHVEDVHFLESENADLIFNGTTVKVATTSGRIVLKMGAQVERAKAGSSIVTEDCPSLGTLRAREVEIKNSTVQDIFAAGFVEISDSTVSGKLECWKASRILRSTVQSIIVHPHCYDPNVRKISRPKSQKFVRRNDVYLNDSIVDDITFKSPGKVYLAGTSEIRGQIKNGILIKC